MPRTLFVVIFALLVTIVFGVPTNVIRKRSFKIHREEQANYVPDGRMAMKRAYLKFGIGDIAFKPSGQAAASIKANTNGSSANTEDGQTPVKATQNDAQFLAPVLIGGQKIVMNFDSGSADT